MRLKFYLPPAFLLILLLPACKSSHKTSTSIERSLPELSVRPDQPSATEYKGTVYRHFDLIHTALEVNFNYEKQQMNGKATIQLKPHFYPSDTLALDARGMLFHKIAILSGKDTLKSKYKYEDDKLRIELGRTFSAKDTVTVYCEYTARPEVVKSRESGKAVTSDKGLYFINPLKKEKGKPRQIWTQSEPQSASVWFPTLDAPNQRMTQEIRITADTSDVTLSNGILISSVDNKNGTRTDTWRMELPHAPYLSMMAIGPYAIVKDSWRGKEVSYYVEPEYKHVARRIFGKTPEMMEFFSAKLGVDYPWAKYSQVTAREYVSGAMENTTATLHRSEIQRTERQLIDEDDEDYVSHELFHQWFGDYVTCESWSNTPLNESFATYGEYLWNEYKYGREAADYGFWQDLGNYLREAETKKVNMIRFEYNQIDDMFDRHSYQKGSCILHLLRKEVGDEAFFASLRNYLEKNKFKSVEIHNLRLAFEEITGKDLNWFFNQWFLDKGHPILDIKYSYDEKSQNTSVTITQLQDTAGIRLFQLNLETDIYLKDTVERKLLTIYDKSHTFTFHSNTKPLLVNVDATKTLPGQKLNYHTEAEWKYQFDHAPLYGDRYEAIRAVPTDYTSSSPYAEMMLTALNDKFWHIRYGALRRMNLHAYRDSVFIKTLLLDMAAKDPKSSVRSMAISRLDERFQGNDLNSFYIKALNDSSYEVVTSALEAIVTRDSAAAMNFAKEQEQNTDEEMSEMVALLYSAFGREQHAAYMFAAIEDESKAGYYSRVKYFGSYLQNLSDQEVIERGIKRLGEISTQATAWYTRFAAMQSISELSSELNEGKISAQKRNRPVEAYDQLINLCSEEMNSAMKQETDPTLKRMYETSFQK